MGGLSNAENDSEMEVPRPKCPQCGSSRNIGGCVNPPCERQRFAPEGLRFLTFKTQVPILEAFLACFDCGHLWSKVSPKELETLVMERGKADTIRGMERSGRLPGQRGTTRSKGDTLC
jgi:hypothetical protein